MHRCLAEMQENIPYENKSQDFVISGWVEDKNPGWYAFILITSAKKLDPKTQTFPIWSDDRLVTPLEKGGTPTGQLYLDPVEAQKALNVAKEELYKALSDLC